MVSLVRYLGAFTLIAASSALVIPGCAVDVDEPDPGGEETSAAAPNVSEPALEPQSQICCFAKCVGDGNPNWTLIAKPAGACKDQAKDYCHNIGYPYKDHKIDLCP